MLTPDQIGTAHSCSNLVPISRNLSAGSRRRGSSPATCSFPVAPSTIMGTVTTRKPPRSSTKSRPGGQSRFPDRPFRATAGQDGLSGFLPGCCEIGRREADRRSAPTIPNAGMKFWWKNPGTRPHRDLLQKAILENETKKQPGGLLFGPCLLPGLTSSGVNEQKTKTGCMCHLHLTGFRGAGNQYTPAVRGAPSTGLGCNAAGPGWRSACAGGRGQCLAAINRSKGAVEHPEGGAQAFPGAYYYNLQ